MLQGIVGKLPCKKDIDQFPLVDSEGRRCNYRKN